MALSAEAKRRIGLALVSESYGEEVSAAIESGSNPQADAVSELGATSDLSLASPAASDINAIFSDTEVEAALDAKADQSAVSDFLDATEDRLDAIESKVDELIQAFKAAGLMAE